MREDLKRAAERIWGDAAKRTAKGPSGPVIIKRTNGVTLRSYEDAGAFRRALEAKHETQRVACILQVTYKPWKGRDPVTGKPYRDESDWIDVEVFDPSFQWGGAAEKETDASGRPKLRWPTLADQLACQARHGARDCRVVLRTDVMPADPGGDSDPVTSPVVRAIHGGAAKRQETRFERSGGHRSGVVARQRRFAKRRGN